MKRTIDDQDMPLPFQIAFKLEKYVHHLRVKGDLPATLVKEFSGGISEICDSFAGMLRIRNTPIPLCHRIHT